MCQLFESFINLKYSNRQNEWYYWIFYSISFSPIVNTEVACKINFEPAMYKVVAIIIHKKRDFK